MGSKKVVETTDTSQSSRTELLFKAKHYDVNDLAYVQLVVRIVHEGLLGSTVKLSMIIDVANRRGMTSLSLNS